MQMKMLVILLVSCYRHDGVNMPSCLLFFGAATLPCLDSFTKLLQHVSYFKRLLKNGDRVEFSHSYLVEQKTNPIYILNS